MTRSTVPDERFARSAPRSLDALLSPPTPAHAVAVRVGRERLPQVCIHLNRIPHIAAPMVAICLSAVCVAGCGGNSSLKQEARQLQKTSILTKTAPLGDRLITQREINSASDSAGVRTFLRLWSLLQFGSWDQAEQIFEPGLRSAIEPSLLAQALEVDSVIWQSTKPKILSARATRRSATISFLARNELGDVVPTSISFGGGLGSWQVSYFSLINPALVRAAQTRTQVAIEPLATKASAAAVRVGVNAGEIQGAYLERKLAGARPRPKR